MGSGGVDRRQGKKVGDKIDNQHVKVCKVGVCGERGGTGKE